MVLDYLFIYLFLRKPIIYIYTAEYTCYLVCPKAQVPELTLAMFGVDGTGVHFPTGFLCKGGVMMCFHRSTSPDNRVHLWTAKFACLSML